MYLQTYSMGWSFKILYSINYTFTLFSEITKLDCFVKHHNIYTNEFFNVQIHRKSPVSKTFFQKDHLQKDKNTICRCVTTKHNRGVLGAVKNCLWSILSRPPKLPPFTRGKNQIPVALTWSFQCHQGLLSASATWFQACEAAEPQTLLSARHRLREGGGTMGSVYRHWQARNTQLDSSHILQHKCPRKEKTITSLTQNRILYTVSLKYSFHWTQQKLHINTLKKNLPTYFVKWNRSVFFCFAFVFVWYNN